MNLDDAKFTTILTRKVELPAEELDKIDARLSAAPVRTAEVIEDDIIVCPHCEVPGSKPVLDLDEKTGDKLSDVSVCDICGCVWPELTAYGDMEDEEDLEEALDLLIACVGVFKEILPRHNVMKKLGWQKEKEIIELNSTIDLFLEQFPWKEES